jgi:hypothetical protein
MKLQAITLTAAAALLLTTVAHAQTPITFTDIGTAAPTPGTLDISQLSNTGTGNTPGLNYYWDDGHQHPTGPGYNGQTFTTGSTAAGYYITSLAIKTDANGGDNPLQTQSFTLCIYQLSGTGLTNATLLHTFTATGTLLTEGDWIQFNNLGSAALKLAPSTTYAYGFGISPSAPENWERLSTATGTTVAGGQICLIVNAGGFVTYSTSPNTYNATFDLGLQSAATPPAIPPAWKANSLATIVTNGVLQWNLWGPGLDVNSFTATAATDDYAEILPLFEGTADEIYGLPTYSYFTNLLEGPNNNNAPGTAPFGGNETSAEAYADQFIGVFIPPVTTNYTFYICSDDYSQLYLSTDITASHAQLIAEEGGWSNPDSWTTSGGGSPLAQKRSDQFVAAGATLPQYPGGIPLVAGWSYFIELVHENGNGGYNDSATYTFTGAPPPANGVDTIISNSLLGYVEQPPSYVSFTQNPANTTVYAGGEAAFRVVPASDATPYGAAYQWQTNGIYVTNADGTAANGQDFTYIVSTNDNSNTVRCVVTYPGANNSNYISSSATITVKPGTVATGGLKREFWSGQTSLQSITSGNLPAPDYVATVTNGSGPINTGIDNYVERYSGWFIPPTTGKYVFFVASDDYSDLFISTDSTPDNKYLIAQETDYATNYEWLTDGAGGVTTGTSIASKRSDQFLPTGATTPPYAAGISLVAGQTYYLEADHDQGAGGDDFSITYKLTTAADPANGTPSAFSGANIAFETGPSTNLTITQNPFSTTVFEGSSATFQVVVATDSGIEPQYEWLLNGTNVGSGLFTNTTSTFTVNDTDLADNGATIQVKVSIPFTTLATNSTVATLTVQKAVTVPGFLKLEYWPNQTSIAAEEAGQVGNPEYVSSLDTFETPVNDPYVQYVQVVSGYFIPPETGLYVFNVSSDDQGDLFLSTDDTAGNLRLIAQENQWSDAYQWTVSAGNSTLSQKESDTWSPDPTATTPTVPYTGGISLKAGSNYFIEGVHFQGGGGDNYGVAFWTEDGNYTIPANGSPGVWASTNIAMLAPSSTVSVVSNPVSVTVISGTTASFSALGSSTSLISVDDVTNVFVSYQWEVNGVPVPGATGSNYTTQLLTTNLNDAQVLCAISAIGAGVTNTKAATLTVTEDTVPPTVLDAFSAYDAGGSDSGEPANQFVDVIFSKAMNLASVLNPANYTIAGATITGVTLFTNGYTGVGSSVMAILQLAAPLTGDFTLKLNNVVDVSDIAVSNPSISGTVDPLTSVDIGGIAVPGTTYYFGPGSYEVDASGIDIWNTQDSFRFVYEPKTNDFDVVVQVPSILPADTSSKGGLMAREFIDPTDGGSRDIYNTTFASATQTAQPLDGTAGRNILEVGVRDGPGLEAYAASTTNFDYIGDGAIAPSYPNQWLRMTRVTDGTNDLFTCYSSSNGVTWTQLATFNPTAVSEDGGETNPFPSVIYVGLCTTAHIAETATPNTYMTTVFYQNYGEYVAGPVLTATLASKTSLSISWTPVGGSLYSSPVLSTNTSSWTLVTANNPATVTISGPSMFFKVVQ